MLMKKAPIGVFLRVRALKIIPCAGSIATISGTIPTRRDFGRQPAEIEPAQPAGRDHVRLLLALGSHCGPRSYFHFEESCKITLLSCAEGDVLRVAAQMHEIAATACACCRCDVDFSKGTH